MAYNRLLVQEYTSVKDFIYIKMFGMGFEEVQETVDNVTVTKKRAILNPTKSLALKPNDFPYFFVPEISHLVCFISSYQ